MSKRKRGFPSERRVQHGRRVVRGDKELTEKLGRNDPCPCGSGRKLRNCCLASGSFRRLRPRSLFSRSRTKRPFVHLVRLRQTIDSVGFRQRRHVQFVEHPFPNGLRHGLVSLLIPFPNRVELDRPFDVHFKGVFFLTQKLLPSIDDGGRIVNISSSLTRFSFPGSSAYASMKGTVEVLTRYLAKELGVRGIARLPHPKLSIEVIVL